MVAIIDYGAGNLNSVYKVLKHLDAKIEIVSSYRNFNKIDKIILPGVGHFQKGMKNLKESGLIDLLNQKVLIEKTPILGICLGMQLFCRFSEEGNAEGLGWLNAETIRFNLSDIRHKVPHIGWNSLERKKESPLLHGIPDDCSYYFVHSYHVKCNDNSDVLASTQYGYEFVSAIQKDNIYGVQFHPEKSHEWGEQLLLNFLKV